MIEYIFEVSMYTVLKMSLLSLVITLTDVNRSDNFWHMCYRKSRQSKGTLFSNLTYLLLLHCEHQNK